MKCSPYFWLALHRTNVRWRFLKILWPSQTIWTLITSLWKIPSEVPTWITALIFILLCRCINGHKLMSDSNKCVWHVGGNKLSYLQKMNLLDTINIFCCCFMSQWLNYCIVNWCCYKKISGEDKIPGIFQIVCNKLKSVDKQIENKNKNVHM